MTTIGNRAKKDSNIVGKIPFIKGSKIPPSTTNSALVNPPTSISTKNDINKIIPYLLFTNNWKRLRLNNNKKKTKGEENEKQKWY